MKEKEIKTNLSIKDNEVKQIAELTPLRRLSPTSINRNA